MKKLFGLILVLTFAVVLAACGNGAKVAVTISK